MPPAVRWEVGLQSPFAHHIEEIVNERLFKKFRVKNVREMSDSQIQYCRDYYRAMIGPFTDNRRWHQLLTAANRSWGRIFRFFENLEEISVGTCERVDQPRPTFTNTFILQHGPLVVEDAFPSFVEDSTVNTAWASSVISRSAPPTVRTLHLSMANMDNFTTVATVNRLLSLSYRCPDLDQNSVRVTRLSLSLRGVTGIHGDRDWHGDTGSAGSLRFWKKTLGSFHMLQHLELHNELSLDENIRFSELERSDTKACLLDCILPGLVLDQLRTLRLCDFLLDRASIVNTLSGHWPRLHAVTLDDVQLMFQRGDGPSPLFDLDHLQGQSWVEVCSALLEKYPSLKIELNRPVSNINDVEDFRLHRKYIEKLQHMGGVHLDCSGLYGSLVKPAKENWDDEQEPLLPNVPNHITIA